MSSIPTRPRLVQRLSARRTVIQRVLRVTASGVVAVTRPILQPARCAVHWWCPQGKITKKCMKSMNSMPAHELRTPHPSSRQARPCRALRVPTPAGEGRRAPRSLSQTPPDRLCGTPCGPSESKTRRLTARQRTRTEDVKHDDSAHFPVELTRFRGYRTLWLPGRRIHDATNPPAVPARVSPPDGGAGPLGTGDQRARTRVSSARTRLSVTGSARPTSTRAVVTTG